MLQMGALKSANKELKGMMKNVNIQDIDVCTSLLIVFSCTCVIYHLDDLLMFLGGFGVLRTCKMR